MKDNTEDFLKTIKPFDEQQQKIALEKHIGLKNLIYIDTMKVLEEYNVNCTKANEEILLSISPMDMRRILELSRNMGFLKAFQEKPIRLRQTITNIIKRIGRCEAESIPYINSDNVFEDFLFREKLFVKKMEELSKQYEEQTEVAEEEQQMSIEYILDVASDLYDDCDISEPKPNIIAAVQFVANKSDLSPKEVLLKVFSKYVDANLLNDEIVKALGLSSGRTRGVVKAA